MCIFYFSKRSRDESNNTVGDYFHNLPDELVSSTGSDNFNLDLMISSTSDSLSEKENIVQQMKNKMRYSSRFLSVPVRVQKHMEFIWRWCGVGWCLLVMCLGHLAGMGVV